MVPASVTEIIKTEKLFEWQPVNGMSEPVCGVVAPPSRGGDRP
jgi:hypothetical protein